jgi:hypothetical protein
MRAESSLRHVPAAIALAAALVIPAAAAAAPSGGSASGSIGSSGAKGSSKGGGYDWPDVVVSGNAISFLMPLQFGLVDYLPRARFAFQYDRQIRKGHWFHIGIGGLFDRGNYRTFKTSRCGFSAMDQLCDKGTVAGVDVYAGYTYKFFIAKKPWLVPYVRGSIGYTFFALPKIGNKGESREQFRYRSQGMTIRPGGGLRIFLLDQLGIGMDVALPLGFLVHKSRGDDENDYKDSSFLLGIEVLPLVVEYRF